MPFSFFTFTDVAVQIPGSGINPPRYYRKVKLIEDCQRTLNARQCAGADLLSDGDSRPQFHAKACRLGSPVESTAARKSSASRRTFSRSPASNPSQTAPYCA